MKVALYENVDVDGTQEFQFITTTTLKEFISNNEDLSTYDIFKLISLKDKGDFVILNLYQTNLCKVVVE
jgi:hypothetical protein